MQFLTIIIAAILQLLVITITGEQKTTEVFERFPDIYLLESHFRTEIKINYHYLSNLVFETIQQSSELVKICEKIRSHDFDPCKTMPKSFDSRIQFILSQIDLFYTRQQVPEQDRSRIFPFYDSRRNIVTINDSYTILFSRESEKTNRIDHVEIPIKYNFDIFKVLNSSVLLKETEQRFKLAFTDYDNKYNQTYSLDEVKILIKKNRDFFIEHREHQFSERNWNETEKKFHENCDIIDSVMYVIVLFSSEPRYGYLDAFILNGFKVSQKIAEYETEERLELRHKPTFYNELKYVQDYSRSTPLNIDYETGYLTGWIETPRLISSHVYKSFKMFKKQQELDENSDKSKKYRIIGLGVNFNGQFNVSGSQFKRECSFVDFANTYLCTKEIACGENNIDSSSNKNNKHKLGCARDILLTMDFDNCRLLTKFFIREKKYYSNCQVQNNRTCTLHCQTKRK